METPAWVVGRETRKQRGISIDHSMDVRARDAESERVRSTRLKPRRSLEDLGYLVLDHPQIMVSYTAMQKLAANNVAVIYCNEKHLPASMLLSLDAHYTQNERFRKQLEASEPIKKQLWKQTIESKITNQAKVLEKYGGGEVPLLRFAKEVKSGDPTNREGQASRYYWKSIFDPFIDHFKRERYGEPPNNLLNYGYALLRAATARFDETQQNRFLRGEPCFGIAAGVGRRLALRDGDDGTARECRGVVGPLVKRRADEKALGHRHAVAGPLTGRGRDQEFDPRRVRALVQLLLDQRQQFAASAGGNLRLVALAPVGLGPPGRIRLLPQFSVLVAKRRDVRGLPVNHLPQAHNIALGQHRPGLVCGNPERHQDRRGKQQPEHPPPAAPRFFLVSKSE